jgi:hypothetical protein
MRIDYKLKLRSLISKARENYNMAGGIANL